MKSNPPRQVGSNAERTRLHNRQLVLQCVRANQPIGRAQIARATHLSTQAVSNIIAELNQQGWLEVVGRHTEGRGLPAVLYALKANGAIALGIEVRPDAVFAALVDLSGKPLFNQRVALNNSHPTEVASVVQQTMHTALQQSKLPKKKLLGAGIVLPGPLGRVGLSDTGQSTLVGWDNTDPQKLFSALLNIPTVIEHDSVAAAVSEQVSGVATDLQTYAFIYFGTGIGLGVVENGQVLRGAFGNAGEIGHVIVQPAGRACGCGNNGCLETYVSRFALRKHMAENGHAINNGEDLLRLFTANDSHLMGWLEQACQPLAQAVGMLENLLDPETVILGGAMPDVLLDYMIARLPLPDGSVSDRMHRTVPRVLRGASGRMTAALGGAALIINDIFTPRIAASQ